MASRSPRLQDNVIRYLSHWAALDPEKPAIVFPLTVRSDGSLESIEINRSSGKKVLDEAAINIVKLAGQNGFAPFPPDISRDTDILHITRTWVFASTDMLFSR